MMYMTFGCGYCSNKSIPVFVRSDLFVNYVIESLVGVLKMELNIGFVPIPGTVSGEMAVFSKLKKVLMNVVLKVMLMQVNIYLKI